MKEALQIMGGIVITLAAIIFYCVMAALPIAIGLWILLWMFR
jgi:hypothetical protein